MSLDVHHIMIEDWIFVGKHLGLNEVTEQFARLCARRDCEFHARPCDARVHHLPLCKGCDQVRYCSPECQRKYVIQLICMDRC